MIKKSQAKESTLKYILFAVFMFCFQNIVHAQSFKVLKSNIQQGDVLIFSIAPQWQQSSPPVAVAIFGKHYLPNQRGEILIEAYARGDRSEKYFDGDFVVPLDRIIVDETRAIGDIFSPFGGENHRGVDLITLDPRTGKHQRPVKAINSGKVVLARKVSLEGNLVIIDHGSGIFSLYMHLSKFSVKQGESVKTGQIIGMSGKTGRVTGPHLHFGIRV